jgi:hypothetical protein
MALKQIFKSIKKTLKNDNKTRIDQYKNNKIRFIFSEEHGVNTVTTLILDGYLNTPAVKKYIAQTQDGNLFTKAEMDQVKTAVKSNWRQVFSVKNITAQHTSLGYNVTKTQKAAKQLANSFLGGQQKLFPVAIYKTGTDVTAIYFASFYGPKHKFGGGDAQNVVVRNLMNECINNTIDDMTTGILKAKPFGLGGKKPVVTRGTLLSNMPREGTYRRRVHGEPIGTRTGGSDTTVPSVNFIEIMQKHSKDIAMKAAVKGKLPTGIVDKLLEEAVDSMTMGLKIKRKSMSSATKHSSQVEIQMTLGNETINTYQNTRADKHPLTLAAESVERAMLHKFSDPKYQASESPADRLGKIGAKQIIDNLFPHKTKPDMRLKINKKLAKQGKAQNKTETFVKSLALQKASSKVKKREKARSKRPPTGRNKGNVAQAASNNNPMALKTLLNEMLGEAVAKNMTSPALRYRTGKLANSVRIDNITQGPRGGNTMIETSYATDPYGTYAPGGKKYTTQRDPERLIKRSVREVAQALVGPRFGIQVDR